LGGSADISPLSDNQDISANAARAFPSAEEIAVRTEAGLSAFTMILKSVEGSSAVVCPGRWGKEARNNPAILRPWDGFSQFMTMTVKTLEGVEFIEAAGIVDDMLAGSFALRHRKKM
jgi:hypothetical protein